MGQWCAALTVSEICGRGGNVKTHMPHSGWFECFQPQQCACTAAWARSTCGKGSRVFTRGAHRENTYCVSYTAKSHHVIYWFDIISKHSFSNVLWPRWWVSTTSSSCWERSGLRSIARAAGGTGIKMQWSYPQDLSQWVSESVSQFGQLVSQSGSNRLQACHWIALPSLKPIKPSSYRLPISEYLRNFRRGRVRYYYWCEISENMM